MTRQDSAPGMGEGFAQVTLIGRLATAPQVIRTPSGLTVTMLRLAVCDEVHQLVTLGFQAESAGELESGQRLYVEGMWQAREEGRRELAVSVLRVLPDVPGLSPERQHRNAEWEHWFYGGRPELGRPEGEEQ